MPVRASIARARQRVVRYKRAMASAPTSSGSHSNDFAINEGVISRMAGTSISHAPIDPLYTTESPIRDLLVTVTSKSQDSTVEKCLPLLAAEEEGPNYNVHGVPRLRRDKHIAFLKRSMGQLPAPFVAADASRPWVMYWALNGLSLLGSDVSIYQGNLALTARHMQNASGGFGSGLGQRSHLATTYAMVLALCIVGGEIAYDVIDRRGMWKWLCSLKQPSGGFAMSVGGEVDVRGAYCATVIISLLNLPLDLSSDSPARSAGLTDLFTGTADYVRKCQTFEGGISGKPDAEAHGAYAFCALGCLSILDAPHRIIPRVLDVPQLISWLSSRQYSPEGGFSGRTNKLVDGCYSHWVGACWPLLQASLEASPESAVNDAPNPPHTAALHSFYDREGLIRYIMACGQDHSPRGGMRDKPGMRSDGYHTCYVLSGLTSAQHIVSAIPSAEDSVANVTWTVSPYDHQIFDEEDRLNPTDPVYAVPEEKRVEMTEYFLSKPGF